MSEVFSVVRVDLDADSEDWDAEEAIEVKLSQELIFALGEVVDSHAWNHARADDSNPQNLAAQGTIVGCEGWRDIRKSDTLDNSSEQMDGTSERNE